MSGDTTLKGLLSKNYQYINDYNKYFADIAKELMCNHRILKGNTAYDIVEIEFYLFTPKHQDVITYPRATSEGQWFFHQSGVDLTFKSVNVEFTNEETRDTIKEGNGETSTFGGILIRGIRRLRDKKYIWGPLKCVNELWDIFDSFSSNAYPILQHIEREVNPNNLWRGKRWIRIKESVRGKRVQEWSKRVGISDFKGAEQYIHDVLNVQDTHNEDSRYLYRYIYLHEDDLKDIKTSDYIARPKVKYVLRSDNTKYTFAEMSKVQL